MKTVSGSVLTSKPISLSKAASILNSFISFENGSSHALSTYLRRTSESLNGLVEFHGELLSKKSERKRKKNRLETLGNGNLIKVEENYSLGEERSNGYGEDGKGSEIKKKKTKSKSEDQDGLGEVEERGSEGYRERKKRKKMEEEGELDEAEVMRSGTKKRKH